MTVPVFYFNVIVLGFFYVILSKAQLFALQAMSCHFYLTFFFLSLQLT